VLYRHKIHTYTLSISLTARVQRLDFLLLQLGTYVVRRYTFVIRSVPIKDSLSSPRVIHNSYRERCCTRPKKKSKKRWRNIRAVIVASRRQRQLVQYRPKPTTATRPDPTRPDQTLRETRVADPGRRQSLVADKSATSPRQVCDQRHMMLI